MLFRTSDPNKELIKSYFKNNNVQSAAQYDYKQMFRGLISHISSELFSVLTYYFNKYTEPQFHKRMKGQYLLIIKARTPDEKPRQVVLNGFDFIGDLRKNHRVEYGTFISAATANKKYFQFNESDIITTLIQILRNKGWHLTDLELQCIRDNIRRLHNILYLEGWDSID